MTNGSDAAPTDNQSQSVLDLFASICDNAATVVGANRDWGESGRREGQYAIDLDVDDVCVRPLLDAGFDVLSEESGLQLQGAALGTEVVVVDPLDGSTNASIGLPWCATALCLVSNGVPTAAMVTNLATGDRYSAVKGHGAARNRRPISVGAPTALDDAIVAVNGLPATHWGWRQFRALGAAALDIAAVARGGFDGYVDATVDSHGVWDYLASVLILEEAGGVAVDAQGRDLVVLDYLARRTPIVAANAELLEQLLSVADLRQGR